MCGLFVSVVCLLLCLFIVLGGGGVYIYTYVCVSCVVCYLS